MEGDRLEEMPSPGRRRRDPRKWGSPEGKIDHDDNDKGTMSHIEESMIQIAWKHKKK